MITNLPRISLVLLAAFAVITLAMPAIRDSYGVTDTISEGAVGEHGWLQAAAFVALAMSSFALAAALAMAGQRRVAMLVATSALCVALLPVFPTVVDGEQTFTGRAHNALAGAAFATNIVAMATASLAFRAHPVLERIALASGVLAATSALFVLLLAAGVEPRGAMQRASVAVNTAWMTIVALRLIQRGALAA